jgi:hypothetical protein
MLEGTWKRVNDMKNRATRETDVLAEAVAGLFWMHLNLPEDISGTELEGYADGLISSIQSGASELAIEQRLKALQTAQLCQPLNLLAINLLTKRIFGVVKRPAPFSAKLVEIRTPFKKAS